MVFLNVLMLRDISMPSGRTNDDFYIKGIDCCVTCALSLAYHLAKTHLIRQRPPVAYDLSDSNQIFT